MQNEREENREKHTQYRQGSTDRYSSAPFDESELDVWTEQFNRILAELRGDLGPGREIWALFPGKSVA